MSFRGLEYRVIQSDVVHTSMYWADPATCLAAYCIADDQTYPKTVLYDFNTGHDPISFTLIHPEHTTARAYCLRIHRILKDIY